MKKSLSTVLGWLSSWREQAAQAEAAQTLPVAEHERRLRELQRSGRMQFLP
jgi:hypothetical protein